MAEDTGTGRGQRDAGSPRRGWRRGFLLSAGAALVGYVLWAVWSDLQSLREVLADFPWAWLPLVLALTLANYGGRLFKWLWYLDIVDAGVSRRVGAKIFGVGMAMVLTPGKVGELLKSWMVRNAGGASMSVTMPIVLAERLTDGLAMILLASAGLLSLEDPRIRATALLALGGMLVVVIAVQFRPLAHWILDTAERVRGLGRAAGAGRRFYDSSYELLGPRNLALSVLIGALSWAFEGLAYFVVLVGVGVEPSLETALTAIFIFSVATVVGAVVATPGGLGGVEATLVLLSGTMLGLDRSTATAAALIIRFATLWFGVGIGLVCLALFSDLLDPVDRAAAADLTEAR